MNEDFAAWMMQVDRLLLAKVGLTSADLVDAPYFDSWNDGLDAEEMLDVIAEYDELLAAMLEEADA